jgi:hypothetical protein
MSRSTQDYTELRSLIDAVCEESITAEQMERLQYVLLTHPEAEVYYVQYMTLHADLCHSFSTAPRSARSAVGDVAPAAPTVKDTVPASRRRQTSLSPRLLASLSGLAAVAAGLFVAILLLRTGPTQVLPVIHGAGEPVDNTVAVLLHAPGAEWDAADAPPRPGAPLAPGWLRLKSGFAQIEFYSGAKVILEGPAELRLISRSEAYCASGKLRAVVPPQAHGFTIGSPAVDLVDRGTEFGLNVGAGRKTEVHVFEGKVELFDPGADREAAPHKDLTTGQGVRVEDAGTLRPIPSNPAAFATAHQLADRASTAAEGRQRDWLAASERLRRDPSLRVYFPFQDGPSWSRTLLDRAGRREQPCDGVIVGCSWVAGRWPGKQALEFKRVSDRVRFSVPGEFDALTMMTWIRVDALPNRYSSLMMTDGWDMGATHWHIREDGKMSLGVKGFDFAPGVNYFTGPVFTPAHVGQWTHLAIVYDRASDQVAHYVDGKAVKRVPLKMDVPLQIGNAEIGNWNPASHSDTYPIRYLSGCMDEFMMFARALGEQEIRQVYTQGRPPQ